MKTAKFIGSSIVVTSDGCEKMEHLLDYLNELCEDEDFADQVSEVMPKDYHTIMIDEDYGVLFSDGSPQMYECGWRMTYTITYAGTTLTICNLK